ncbi:sensor histidine kinase [Actinokineospora sp. G85]|uniref:sensor histidine kinase n=1 Tax=Actinokineospora sp. G85 TaxID=3406626 RepID=UPI003C75424B
MVLRDAALWALLSAGCVLAFLQSSAPAALPLHLVAPVVVLAVAIPASRRWPGAAVFAVNGLCALGLADPGTPASGALPALAVTTYLLGRRTASARSALALFGACLAVDLGVCAVLGVDAVWWFYVLSMVPAALLLPWLAGRFRRAQVRLVRGGWERAAILEQRQRSVAEQARLRERTRIAADMHDSLGHQLSLIALRAGALETSPALDERDQADFTALRLAAADAIDNLRETIGALREVSAAPTSESVEELVRRTAESGVAVELVRTGVAPDLSPLVDRAVYRVVQESLTNATKHAPGSAVRVRITHSGGWTEVRVRNSPPPAGPLPGFVPGNRGLIGLRERVGVVGGTLRTGPHEGGFEVLASVPDRPGVADQAEDDAGSESTQQLAAARRSVRLRLVAAFAAPAAVVLLAIPSAVFLYFHLSTSVLNPADYEALRLGQSRAEFADVLPAREFRFVSDEVREAPKPAGATCEHYRSNSNLLAQVDVFRLCYTGGRLVAKEALADQR